MDSARLAKLLHRGGRGEKAGCSYVDTTKRLTDLLSRFPQHLIDPRGGVFRLLNGEEDCEQFFKEEAG